MYELASTVVPSKEIEKQQQFSLTSYFEIRCGDMLANACTYIDISFSEIQPTKDRESEDRKSRIVRTIDQNDRPCCTCHMTTLKHFRRFITSL